jgi:hypothetical protein
MWLSDEMFIVRILAWSVLLQALVAFIAWQSNGALFALFSTTPIALVPFLLFEELVALRAQNHPLSGRQG